MVYSTSRSMERRRGLCNRCQGIHTKHSDNSTCGKVRNSVHNREREEGLRAYLSIVRWNDTRSMTTSPFSFLFFFWSWPMAGLLSVLPVSSVSSRDRGSLIAQGGRVEQGLFWWWCCYGWPASNSCAQFYLEQGKRRPPCIQNVWSATPTWLGDMKICKKKCGAWDIRAGPLLQPPCIFFTIFLPTRQGRCETYY